MENSLNLIQTELERARERLKEVDDRIKKNTGRPIVSPSGRNVGFKRRITETSPGDNLGPKEPQRPRLSFEGISRGRGGRLGPPVNSSRFGGRNQAKSEEGRISAKKRLGEQTAVTVFSRLSGPPKDDEYDRKEPVARSEIKLTSHVVTTQDLPSRKEILAAQSGDNQCRARNRRMFGALLGHIQKFRQEENQLKEKEQKRAQVEKKLEEAALREKEELKKTRAELFSNRRQQQFEIKQLEFKLMRLKQLTEWETTRKHLLNFIQTKAGPKIFWIPKTHNEKTQKLQDNTRSSISKVIEAKRAEVEKSIADHADQRKDDNMDDSKEEFNESNENGESINETRMEDEELKSSEEIQEPEDFIIPDEGEDDNNVPHEHLTDEPANNEDNEQCVEMETEEPESKIPSENPEESFENHPNGRLSDVEPPPES